MNSYLISWLVLWVVKIFLTYLITDIGGRGGGRGHVGGGGDASGHGGKTADVADVAAADDASLEMLQEDFKLMIEDAGFSQVTYENLMFGVAAIHSAFKLWSSHISFYFQYFQCQLNKIENAA